ncbi:hypothetical protein [Woodsholea maritima]|uniref:hypothetical protein n=1 Tax=Woodsholea maritima TaxID=240237 RepID=UPI00036FEF2E|nr:hypothetical protein [Woodsholea maritima]
MDKKQNGFWAFAVKYIIHLTWIIVVIRFALSDHTQPAGFITGLIMGIGLSALVSDLIVDTLRHPTHKALQRLVQFAQHYYVVWVSVGAISLIALFGYWTIRAGVIGVLITTAILIPVTTIIYVTGGHRSIFNWFRTLKRKS